MSGPIWEEVNDIRINEGTRKTRSDIFVLLLEGLEENKLEGTQINMSFLYLHNLFCADDSLFFMRATNRNVQPLKGILDETYRASSKEINEAKSNVHFSNNTMMDTI